MKTLLLFAALALASAAACGSPSDSSDGGGGGTETCPTMPPLSCTVPNAKPSYAKDAAPIIKERCSPCHFAGGISDQIYDLSTRTNVVDADTAMLSQFSMCAMPPIHGNSIYNIPAGSVPGLTQDQLDTLVNWIECGALP